jgi:hypothetical protein
MLRVYIGSLPPGQAPVRRTHASLRKALLNFHLESDKITLGSAQSESRVPSQSSVLKCPAWANIAPGVQSAVRRLLGFDNEVEPPPIESLDPMAFFSALDKFQRAAYRRLRLRYPEPDSESFCKLVALKAANGFAAGYHYRNRHSVLVSRPVQLQVDPTNACNLHCPSCLHSANADWASRFDWPSATLSIGQFDEFCSEFGPFATSIALFRDGEPLLHRRFADFVTLAKSHLLYALTSTNLSMPIDAESLVASGLDRLVAAIDGAGQATYCRYRRG